jgi:hypothetical protein
MVAMNEEQKLEANRIYQKRRREKSKWLAQRYASCARLWLIYYDRALQYVEDDIAARRRITHRISDLKFELKKLCGNNKMPFGRKSQAYARHLAEQVRMDHDAVWWLLASPPPEWAEAYSTNIAQDAEKARGLLEFYALSAGVPMGETY